MDAVRNFDSALVRHAAMCRKYPGDYPPGGMPSELERSQIDLVNAAVELEEYEETRHADDHAR